VNTVLGFQMRRVQSIGTPARADDSIDPVEEDDEPEISESA